jgi:hypothetical protein
MKAKTNTRHKKHTKTTLSFTFEDYKSLLGHPILKPFATCQLSHEGICKHFFYGVNS